MPGKDPHRPEGKTADAEHMNAQRERQQLQRAFESPPRDANAPAPTRYPAEEEIGGSRPRVPSRVKDAIEQREARDAPDE
jgi:hypothetical protein